MLQYDAFNMIKTFCIVLSEKKRQWRVAKFAALQTILQDILTINNLYCFSYQEFHNASRASTI